MNKIKNAPKLGNAQGVGLINKISNYAGLALLYLFAVMPHGLMKILARASAWLMWHVNGRLRKIGKCNLEICFPDMPAAERMQLTRKSLYEVSLSILHVGRTWIWRLERMEQQISRVVGEEHLRAVTTDDRGIVVLLPHMGNWELVNIFLTKRYQITSLYRQPKTTVFSDVVLNARERTGARLVPANASGVRAMLTTLKAGNMVTMLPDQVPPRKFGTFAPFFGEPTLTMTLATNLIHRTRAKALCAFCRRLPDGKYELVFQPVEEAIYDADSETALAAMNRAIERCIMDCPEQYQWEYKRFKFLPNMQKRDYFGDRNNSGESLGHREA